MIAQRRPVNRLNPDALGAADAIANQLANPPTIPTAHTATGRSGRRAQSLADGAAGIALLYIERARAGHGDWSTAHAWLSAAGEDISAGPNASLSRDIAVISGVKPGLAGRCEVSHSGT